MDSNMMISMTDIIETKQSARWFARIWDFRARNRERTLIRLRFRARSTLERGRRRLRRLERARLVRTIAERLRLRLAAPAQRYVFLPHRQHKFVAKVIDDLELRRQHQRAVLAAADGQCFFGHGNPLVIDEESRIRIRKRITSTIKSKIRKPIDPDPTPNRTPTPNPQIGRAH